MSGTSLPDSMFSMASPIWREARSTPPPSTAASAGAPPSYGTGVPSTPASPSSSAVESCEPVPTPDVPYLRVPVAFFTSSSVV